MSAGSGWSGPATKTGVGPSAPLLFTLAVQADPRSVVVSYGGNPGSAGAAASQAPQRYPTSRCTFRRLRVTVLENTLPLPFTVALCRNDGHPTALAIAISAGAVRGFKDVAYAVVAFDDSDDFDVRLEAGACEGTAKVSVSVER